MDKELRRLERIFHESGIVEDEARLLRERLRVGRLNQRQIELASYLEYPAARLIIETPITICSILDGTNAADTIAEAWEAALAPPDVLFAAMLAAARELVSQVEEDDDERRTLFLATLNRGLRAAALAFANNEYPDTYGFDGQIYHELQYEYRRSPFRFVLMCIYNLCEALNAHYLDHEEQVGGYSRMVFHNALRFCSDPCAYPSDIHGEHDHDACLDAPNPHTCEWLCRRIGEQLVPWLLSEWPPTPRRFVELNFDVELE